MISKNSSYQNLPFFLKKFLLIYPVGSLKFGFNFIICLVKIPDLFSTSPNSSLVVLHEATYIIFSLCINLFSFFNDIVPSENS